MLACEVRGSLGLRQLSVIFLALLLAACAPRPPGLMTQPEIFQQSPASEQVRPFGLPAHSGPLGIDLAADTSDVVDQLRGSGIDFVARYYRGPTSSLPTLSPSEAQKLSSLGLNIVVVWEQNSPDPENISYSNGYNEAVSAYQQATAIGQSSGSAIYFAVDLNIHDLDTVKEYFHGIAAGLAAASDGTIYKVGVYGSGAVCKAVKRAGLAQYSWLSKATTWDGSLDYSDWDIKQGEVLPTFSFDNDSDEARGDYGGFRLDNFNIARWSANE